ncbi:guanine nucleotide binding protein, alpha subunit [Mycena vulgaris]|nr:guanine nucleotide binding protein, alpha subunit [Mycena vulgaris]
MAVPTPLPTSMLPTRNVWPPPPPAVESDAERAARVEAEREAKRISNAIDESLAIEREQRKRPSNAKILLLGQAESGKSTILKNFQLHFAPKAFQAEAEAWRPVIHLNLVRSVNFVLGLLDIRHPSTYSGGQQPASPDSPLSGQLRRLSISLAPLRQVEESLSNRIAGSRPPDECSEADRYNPAKASEISLRSGSGWTAFLRFRRGSTASDRNEKAEELQTRRILSACAADIVTLWAAPEVQQGLRDRDITLQEQSGFFLDEVERVCRDDYIPTSDDILRARVHTVGPEEHVINMESASENVRSWTVYDMGGSTSQRVAWAQFFDDVHVIIFLAPISAFNETLAENHSVNRLADSLKLWRTICSNKLLISVEFILFLNKVDILTRKLHSGIRFAEHVTSFRNKPNDPKEVIKYLSDAFATINQTYSPRKRRMHRHVTCAIDTKATSVVINDIREVILLNALTATNIL